MSYRGYGARGVGVPINCIFPLVWEVSMAVRRNQSYAIWLVTDALRRDNHFHNIKSTGQVIFPGWSGEEGLQCAGTQLNKVWDKFNKTVQYYLPYVPPDLCFNISYPERHERFELCQTMWELADHYLPCKGAL